MLTTPHIARPITLDATDLHPLDATLFEPAGARATVVIHGATAVPRTYYHPFAAHLAGRGLRVLTYDYRGIGGSRPHSLVGFDATMRDWAEKDARAAHRFAARLGDPVITIGHSFGGQLLGLLDEPQASSAVILVAAQLGYFGHWPLGKRIRYAAMWHALIPALVRLHGYLPGRFGLGEDLPAGVALEWARWCRHPDYLVGHVDGAAERFARFDRPTLFFSFTDDPFAPPGAVDALLRRLGSAPVSHRRVAPWDLGLPDLGHFSFFRPRAASLWPEVLSFVDATLAGELPRPGRLTLEDLQKDLFYGMA
jgi:predicted alpha/beta hydrolase